MSLGWIRAIDLDQWADRITADSDLPRLIDDLLRASNMDMSIDMPGGELTRLSGFDGVVRCDDSIDHVPKGLSAWELSTRKDIAAKASEDYDKRVANPLTMTPAETTFVFATPRKWANAMQWRADKQARKEWSDVRVLWAWDLERWLKRHPWVASTWAPAVLNRPVIGIRSISRLWVEYSRIPSGNGQTLAPEFVIGDRPTMGLEFLNWLAASVPDNERKLHISGPSCQETLHYLVATIRAQSKTYRLRCEARVFEVHTSEAAQSLGPLGPHHVILVPPGEAIPYVLEMHEKYGCRVVIYDKDSPDIPSIPGVQSLRLLPMSQSTLVRSMVGLGYTDEAAGRLCVACGFEYSSIRTKAFLQ